MAAASSHFEKDRVVFTYAIDGFAAGILTGYEWNGGFVLENVLSLPGHPPGVLSRTLKAGEQCGRARGYTFIALFVPHTHPLQKQLESLARRFRYRVYKTDEHYAYYSKEL